jgi:predicted nucleic acid-binding Zn ribbon protein
MNTLPRDRCCVCSEVLSRSSRRYCSRACRSLIAEFYEFSTLQFILINLRWAGAPIRKKL